jgi:hypothetical protein
VSIGPRHHDLAGFKRRTQGIESLGAVLGKLVQEEHAVVREGGLAGPGAQAAAGQGGHGGGVMRRAERPVAGQTPALDQPRHRPDHGGLEQLLRRQRGEQAGQARRHHRLAGPRRADEQQIVPPGRRDLQRPLGALLALDLAQVGDAVARAQGSRLGPAQHLGPLEVVDQTDQGPRGQDRHLPGPGGFRPVGLRTDQAKPHGVGRHRRGQGPADGGDPPVQPQLADRRPTGQHVRRNDAHRRQQGQGDGQVEMAALLGHVGRGQIGDDPHRRQRQTDAGEGPADPLPALGHRLVGQADDGEGRMIAAGQLLDLHVHPSGVDALEGHRDNAREHAALPLSGRERTTNRNDWQERRYADRFFSITSHIRAAASTPVKRFSCWAPVGEVTLISVR